MRLLSVLMVTAAAVTAQSPLTTTFASNNGGAAGGAVYFDLECLDPAGLTIDNMDLNFTGLAGQAGSIDVYIVPDSHAPHTQVWVGPVATGVVASTSAEGTPTNIVLTPPLQLGQGCKLGIAIVANGIAHAYTTATGLPATWTTAELELTVGGGSNTPFAGSLFFPRLVNTNINYTSGGTCPDLASVVSQGPGCLAAFTSFYEVMTPAAMDLSGMTVTGTNSASGYTITTAPGVANAIGSLGAATVIVLGDDDVQPAGGTLGLEVSSNGQVFNGAGGSSGFAPSIPTFLGSAGYPEAWAFWTDMQPNAAGSGQVFYEEDGGSVGQFTFDGVYGWNTTDPNEIQFVLDTATGDFSITFGVTQPGNPESWLVGYSPAGPSADPGNSDISAGSITTATSDTLPLELIAVGRPVQLRRT